MAGVRISMAELIAQVRDMINDPAGSSQRFTDLQIQDRLDDRSTLVRYLELEPLETRAPNTVATYLEYVTRGNYYPFEGDAKIYDGLYTEITDIADVDYKRGQWKLNTSHLPPIFVVGTVFDVYWTASELCLEWAQKEALAYDYNAEDKELHRSQKSANLNRMAKQFAARARPTFVRSQ